MNQQTNPDLLPVGALCHKVGRSIHNGRIVAVYQLSDGSWCYSVEREADVSGVEVMHYRVEQLRAGHLRSRADAEYTRGFADSLLSMRLIEKKP